MTVAVIGAFRLPLAAMDAARAAMRAVLIATRAEAGCIEYNYAEDVLEPGLIRVSEVWESRAHLAAHLRAPHMAAWTAERAALGLSDRRITVYETSSAETI